MHHERFHYKTPQDILDRAGELGVHVPLSGTSAAALRAAAFGNVVLRNRLGVAPLEGADGNRDGSPSEMTLRRYLRYARGGAGLIWIEAVALAPEARNGLKQLMLTRDNLDSFKAFVAAIREAGMEANGFSPYLVIQAHHSGRYSAPDGTPAPLIAYRHPMCDGGLPLTESSIVTDDYLKHVEEEFAEFAYLAREAGFDAVDVKCCHGYLLPELTAAYTRPGLYGGCYENRTRLLKNSIAAAKAYETDSFLVTARIGIYDGPAWPWGFGVRENGDETPDMTEPIRLVRELHEQYGVPMVNLTVGNPCIFNHYNRPFDIGPYVPDEHPLVSVARGIRLIGEVKRAVPEMFVSASAASYMRQFAGRFVAGAIEEGLCDHMLFGRMSYSNPDFPRQMAELGDIDPMKTCVGCEKCESLIASGRPAGCPIRDREVYGPYYRELTEQTRA